jgi:putative tryptophan/tyrosine transport system substrate-binding protein
LPRSPAPLEALAANARPRPDGSHRSTLLYAGCLHPGGGSIKRREFIGLVGGAAVAWPLALRAQQRAIPVIGFLNAVSPYEFADRLRGFHRGLKETGYVEGENVAIEFRWAEDQLDRLPVLAVVSGAGPTVPFAAKAATTTIPIDFLTAEDPVRLGLVASLARQGANLTGINFR